MAEFWTENWDIVAGSGKLKGGQGTVRQVKHKSSGVIGALKECNDQQNPMSRHRMVREVKALERLDGRGVPRILDHNIEDVDDNGVKLFVVMSWVDGLTLQSHLDSQAMTLLDALHFTRTLSGIVATCHDEGISHRDIKPLNIIVCNNAPVLVDFGIAWSEIDDASPLTKPEAEMGNRFLRLPELSAGRDKRDNRCDITFVVGILFYLLTNVEPRLLRDERGLPPHEAQQDAFRPETLADEHWPYVIRIFNIGFQLLVDYRYQEIQELITTLDEAINLTPQPKGQYSEALAKYHAFTEQERAKILMGLADVLFSLSRQMEEFFRELAARQGLDDLSELTSEINGLHAVTFHRTLKKRWSSKLEVYVEHIVEIDPDDISYVRAKYQLEYGLKWTTYYRGLATDTERLREVMMAQAETIFGLAIEKYHQACQHEVEKWGSSSKS